MWFYQKSIFSDPKVHVFGGTYSFEGSNPYSKLVDPTKTPTYTPSYASDDAVNLSILITAGKENNYDSPSRGD